MRLTVVALAFVAACGIPKEEHEKAVGDLRAQLEQVKNEKAALEEQQKQTSGELTNVSNKNVSLEKDLGATKEELEKLRKQREQYEKRMKAFQDLAAKLKSMVDAGKLQVQIRKGRMLVRLPDNVLFPAGSATLKKEGQAAIAEIATALAEIKDRDFVVAGHTDNVPMKSARFPSNWELSSQRAIEVAKWLITKGVNPAQLSAAGYSDNDPVAPNDTAENKQANRRIEIIVMPNIEELPQIDDKV